MVRGGVKEVCPPPLEGLIARQPELKAAVNHRITASVVTVRKPDHLRCDGLNACDLVCFFLSNHLRQVKVGNSVKSIWR